MKSRCLNPRNDAYHYYGERGITVCERWRDSFTNFLEDMGHAPAGLRIERKDNDGNYEPGNCIWATHTVQMRNTRRTRKLTVRGVTGCLDELAQHFGVNGKAAWYKLRLGWTPEEALFTPVKHPRIYFTVRGINGCIAELCRHFGIQHGTALKRLERGWTPDESFCTPVQGSGFRLE